MDSTPRTLVKHTQLLQTPENMIGYDAFWDREKRVLVVIMVEQEPNVTEDTEETDEAEAPRPAPEDET